MKLSRNYLRKLILEELSLMSESFQDDSGPSDGPLFDAQKHDLPEPASELTGRELSVYDIMINSYPHLSDYPMSVYKDAFQRAGQTGMTNMHAVAREMEMLHDDGFYDLPKLTPAIPDDHPSLATGPVEDQHPLDTDGDGNVDWNELPDSIGEGLDFERFAFGQAKTAPQPKIKTEEGRTESHGSLIRSRYYGRY